tara:strand:+ start:26793 stop:28217 length:1425 start_codon:yes stop_codon:yes gene_type:complete
MNYAALSTDIKKSSVNWALKSTWMEQAVSYHNAIIEKIVGEYTTINPKLLPNCPEGDAYTYFFKHEDMETLRRLVVTVGLRIQSELHNERGQDFSPLTVTDYVGEPEFKGKIFIRIGIAFGVEAPFEYYFCRYRPNSSDCRNYNGKVMGKGKVTSYRGTVISMSELAEQRADYKYVMGKEMMVPSITECYMDDGHKFRRIAKVVDFTPLNIQMGRSNSTEITGYCIFVEYKRALSDDLVKTNPYMREMIGKEYASIHFEANSAIDEWLAGHENYEGGLVKEKRDSSSMYVIKHKGSANPKAKNMISLYKKMLILLSDLPFGSCIGVAFGKMQEKTVTRLNNTYYDYFQTTVNNAARMAMIDFSYASKWGYRVKNQHINRLAFTSDNIDKVITGLLDADVFLSVDKVPLKTLNAGGNDTITVISSASKGWETLREGDKVKFRASSTKKTLKKASNDGTTYRIGNQRVPRRDLIKL